MPEPEAVKAETAKKVTPIMPWEAFLELSPPGKSVCVATLYYVDIDDDARLLRPDIKLYCNTCKGERIFKAEETSEMFRLIPQDNEYFLKYTCKNCERYSKSFAVAVNPELNKKPKGIGSAYKFGEIPPFGPRIPSRVFELIGQEDRELFLLGRRAESQGMGIGAFTYYRRVVENQKNGILDEVIKVGEKTHVEQSLIDVLKNAQKEQRFSRAMDLVKDAIPPVLLVDGCNPLTLLHSALSIGLHSQTDAECLESATNIRVVLAALAERAGQALKDEAGLKKAIDSLKKSKSAKKQPAKPDKQPRNSEQQDATS